MSEHSSSPVTRYDLSPDVSTPRSTNVDSRAGSTMATPKNKPALVGDGVPSISTLLGEGNGRGPRVKAKKLSTLSEGFGETLQRDCDKAWAKFFTTLIFRSMCLEVPHSRTRC